MLIIGTRHEYQRWQEDHSPDRDQVRSCFSDTLSKIIDSRHVELIAEEAGDDALVAKCLEEQGYCQGPKEPIAKQVSRNYRFCRHVNIRPASCKPMDTRQYVQEMFNATVAALEAETSILVICGEDHRKSLFGRFRRRGFDLESRRFPPPR